MFLVRFRLVGAGIEEVVDGPAVGYDDAFVIPFVAENLHQQAVTSAAGFAFETVVGTHHFFHVSLTDKVFEGGEIRFPQVTRVYLFGIETVPVPFGTGMYGKMLGTSVQLVILLAVGTLQSAYDRHAHLSGQVGILSIGLLSASPARVAEDVDVGRPYGESLITFQFALAAEGSVLGAGFVGDSSKYVVEQVAIERGSHTDGLREYSGKSGASYAV